MIFSYIYNIVKFKKWKYSLTALFIFIVMFVVYQPVVDQLLELHKCPACYGNSACDYINDVRIDRYDVFSKFSYFLGVKNVFYGTLGERKVVLKKLAHSSELSDFDRMLCENANFSSLCAKETEYTQHNINFDELIEKEVTLNFTRDNYSRLRVCPTTRHLDRLFQSVFLNNKDVDRQKLKINIWTLASLNPEPLLLQILSADEGWPVPKYLGACGRIIVEEYIGLPLTKYHDAPWLIRAKIASSLLNSAHALTFRDKNFAYYLTDISPDNIAVDVYNNAKFVDLENIIVVDKNPVVGETSGKWANLQENVENSNCSNCLAFSSVDICSHKISDHNYYAICQFLLALNISNGSFLGGLLHNVPRDVLQKYPNIGHLIQQCSKPEPPHTRISAGMRLKKVLDALIEK